MAKQQTYQRFIYKVHSSRLRDNKWKLNLSLKEARLNDELIALSDSDVLRFIDDINGLKDLRGEIKSIKSEIKMVKKDENSSNNRKIVSELYDRLDILQLQPDYMCLIIDRKKDYLDACKKGFEINGIKYSRLLGTTGGVKNSTIVFTREGITEELRRRIDNGRNLDIPLVPAKLEAYKALTCSSSVRVTQPRGVLVVDDCFTHFKETVIHLDDTDVEEPTMQTIDDYDIELNVCDGCGMISPRLSKQWAIDLELDYLPAGFCTRDSWEKGMLGTFDFVEFGEKIANTFDVVDIWGERHDIRDVDIVLPISMLKLWDCYSSIGDYLSSCELNGHGFSVTKVTPKELDNERSLNYQFLQSFYLTDEEIQELIQPTIDEINDVLGGDYKKSILFLKGSKMNEDIIDDLNDDYIKALMIDERMIDDPYVRGRIHFMIKKRINEAKTGVVKVDGNFSLIFGDLYALCQNMFNLEVTGLLKANEVYSQYWFDKGVDKVSCFRAPMTCHNNIRIAEINNDENIAYWYRYMNTVTVLNSWDTFCESLNGADKDGDLIFTTNNKVLLNNVRQLPPIMCIQRRAEKKIVTEEDLIESNINSFGDEIGATTNRITGMFEKLSLFDVDSEEHEVLNYRIKCGQLLQQNAIDKSKGIISKPMPKSWYDRKINRVQEEDVDEVVANKEFNNLILADKKPYFMIYIYPSLAAEYKNYMKNNEKMCIMKFGIELDELLRKQDLTEEELQFVSYYYNENPVGVSPCIINKIAWIFEKEFNGYLNSYRDKNEFDYSILMSNGNYQRQSFYAVKRVHENYKKKMTGLMMHLKKGTSKSTLVTNAKHNMKKHYKAECYDLLPYPKLLSDIVIELCYATNNSKQFAWDICGDIFIQNLLVKNNHMINYLELDKDGEVEYCGNRYTMKSKEIMGEKDDN